MNQKQKEEHSDGRRPDFHQTERQRRASCRALLSMFAIIAISGGVPNHAGHRAPELADKARGAGPDVSVRGKARDCFGPGIVDTDEFADHIQRRLAGNVVGFGFAINEGGNPVVLGHGGFARIPFLDGNVLFTFLTDINVFSVSKTITAIAALQLMEKLDLKPKDPISSWLPPTWGTGPGFDNDGITFVDLLTHRTGMLQVIAQHTNAGVELPDTNTWEGLEILVKEGIDPDLAATSCPESNDDGTYTMGNPQAPEGDHYGVYCYKNANYALARLLIWRMALETGDLTEEFDSNDLTLQAEESAFGYQHYVRQNVLQPAGVDGSCSATGPEGTRALAYDIDGNVPFLMVTAGSPTLGDDATGVLGCGPKNWWLSALDLVSLVGELSCGELLSPQSRDLMDELKMGWSKNSDSGTNAGRYWHGGSGFWTRDAQPQLLWPPHPDNPTEDEVVGTKGPAVNRVRTCLMKLPFGIDAALIMNSDLRDSDDTACDVLLEAFDDTL